MATGEIGLGLFFPVPLFKIACDRCTTYSGHLLCIIIMTIMIALCCVLRCRQLFGAFYYFNPLKGAKCCTEHVCVSVCSFACMSQKQDVQTSQSFLHVLCTIPL